ncbi:F-box domain [Macleaya cordata]|uniref:F-box domain n=1 Tax=Macleaya cordata TaxID=56857 RepID=A0A200R1Z7_MACCD|nr:F-box domain [Macleaya cordata]
MENFDLDITSEILSRVPAESVLQCKLVCKTWRNLLRHIKVGLLFSIGFVEACSQIRLNDRKIELYYGEYDEINIDDDQQYSFKSLITRINHPPLENRFDTDIIVGSCNGLACFAIPHWGVEDPVYICNPFTKEYIYLPNSINPQGLIVCGFGYRFSTDEYKVVRIYYHPDDYEQSVGHVEVYTLGSAIGWRNKGEIPYSISVSSSGILANGALHWLDYKEWKIVAFDLADEEFRLLPSPPCFRFGNFTTFYQLQVLGGCLCVVHHERGERLDIWSLKKKKVKEQEKQSWSWSREFSITWKCLDKDGDYEPFALTKTNEVLLWYNGTILSCYDPKTETLKKLMDDDMGIKYFKAIPHMNTSVSLKALGERSRCLAEEDNQIS